MPREQYCMCNAYIESGGIVYINVKGMIIICVYREQGYGRGI